MNILLIISVILLYLYTVTCTFFAVRIAALKGRGRKWGWLGLLLGLVGVIIICFLPNAKGVVGETNPITAAFRKLTGISPVAMWIVLAGVVVIVGGALFGSWLTVYLENREDESMVSVEETEKELLTPSRVNGTVSAVFCGDGNNFAVTDKGDLYGWGNVDLQALDESGKIYENVKKVCVAGDTMYILTAGNTLYAKGDNQNALIPGQKSATVENFVAVEESVKDIALTGTVGAILKESGNLYVFGVNTYGQLGRSADRVADTNQKMASNVKKVVLTGRSLYYLTEGGEVYGVGNNAYGQFGLGDKKAQCSPVQLATDCADVAAGSDFLLVLKKDGTVWSAGNNTYGQLGRKPGEPDETNEEQEGPAVKPETELGQIPNLADVEKIEAGGHSAFALAGTNLYAWGQNHLGQLGKGGNDFSEPTLVHRKAAAVQTNGVCTMLITEKGTLMGAGNGQDYQLGAHSDHNEFFEIAKVG